MRYFRARHLATMVGPLIEDGCVVVDAARIIDVGPTSRINPPRIDEDIDGLLIPGLINAHTHLELTNVPRPEHPGTFQDWLLTTMGSMREPDVETFDRKRAEAVREGIEQCAKFGVTCVGDVSQNVDIVRPILAEGPIRSVSFGECLGLGERRARFHQLLDSATGGAFDNNLLHHGISPHAPYTVDAASYREACTQAKSLNLRVMTHLAETADEAGFLFDHSGPFAALYRTLGFDPGAPDLFGEGPIRFAQAVGLLGEPAKLLVHCNYLDDSEVEILKSSNAFVVYCPRTHAYFRHPPHRWAEFSDGEQLCVGTDSCASAPNLNLVDDLRLMHRENPHISTDFLFRSVTLHGAKALKRSREVGQLSSKYFADMVAFPTQSGNPLDELLENDAMGATSVWIGGRKILNAAI